MNKKKKLGIIVLPGVCLFGLLLYLILDRHMTIPFICRYKAGANYTMAVVHTTNPLDITLDSLQLIDWSLAPDHPQCRFMADPFIVNNQDTLYIFYEHFPAKVNSTWGDIGVMRSLDGGASWTFMGIAIDEPYHLSFPHVFQDHGEWYMLPCSGAISQLVLYKAVDFPMKWEKVKVLRDNYSYTDPMLYHDSIYYLFVSENGEERFALYTADSLGAPLVEHPCSPIRCTWNNHTRLAGEVAFYDGRPYLFMQEHNGGYGSGVAVFCIDSISPTYYHDYALDSVPLLSKTGMGWNADGMHTYNFVRVGNSFIGVVDGSRNHEREVGWDWKNYPKFRW